MNNLNEYKDELFPLMYRDLNLLFPDMDFSEERGGKRKSRHHLDGNRDKQGKEITSVEASRPYSVSEFQAGSKGLINWYMERNPELSFKEALDKIADICGKERFQWTEQGDADRKTQEKRQNALDLFVRNLWSGRTEAQKVLDYLHSRKWTDEDIRKAELGLITPDLRPQLPDADSYLYRVQDAVIGETHLLTIPYRTASRILGFKFREIGVKTSSKYINSKSLKKSEGLLGLGIGIKDAVIVEGELDQLHAIVRGVKNVVATAGGGISSTQAQDAIKRGVKKFTLLLDNDEAGKGFIDSSLSVLGNMGAEVFIAYLPDGCKDADEYLSDHTAEELQGIIDRATSSYLYEYDRIFQKYLDLCNAQGELYHKQVTDFYSEIEKILTSPYLSSHPHFKEQILLAVEAQANDLQLNPSDFRKWIEMGAERRLKEKQEAVVKGKVSQAKNLLDGGKVDEAIELLRDTVEEQDTETKSATYSSLLHDDIDETLSAMRNRPKGIETNIVLGDNGYRFYIPSGAITIIGAPTGHGKSKMLMSLALDAMEKGEGTILYVTFEENKESVLKQMINAYANIDITAQYGKHGNLQTIGEYFATGSTQFIRRDSLPIFESKVKEFLSRYKSNEIKIIRPLDNYSTSLCGLLRYALTELPKVKAIFVDYVQELYLPDYKAKMRSDELKQIMVDLDLIAQETSLPIVMGAQLTRATASPTTMSNQDLADSAWIERKASEILLLWSNKEKVKDSKLAKEVEQEYPTLDLGSKGKLLAKLTKSRYSETGITAILEINGNTGRIKGNKTEVEDKENSSNFDPFSPSDDRPVPF